MTTSVNNQKTKEFLKCLMNTPCNKKCADCGNSQPSWASLTFSFFICYDCASQHRKMGVHRSKVKSTQIDEWGLDELRRMYIGGNKNARKLETSEDFNIRYHGTLEFVQELDRLEKESNILEPEDEFMKIKKKKHENNVNPVILDDFKVQKPRFCDNFEESEEEEKEFGQSVHKEHQINNSTKISEVPEEESEDSFYDFRAKPDSKDNLKKTVNKSRSPFCFNLKDQEESSSE